VIRSFLRLAAGASPPAPNLEAPPAMPPKKVVQEEVLGPWSLGRFSSNLKVRFDALDRASSSSKIASRGWMRVPMTMRFSRARTTLDD